MKRAEQRWSSYTDVPELFAGEHLLHTEWSPGNVLVNDAAHLVDWAWATRGAGWIDPACWVVWLVASGHSPQSAENWSAQVPTWHAAPRDCLDAFAWAQAGMWDRIAQDGPETWTQRMASAARQWVEHRDARMHRNRRDPKFMNAKSLPNVHPHERLVTPEGEQVEIDTEMILLVRALWARGLVTVACCQDIGESAAGHRDPERTTPSGHGGFVEYYRGYAWLKMPLNDGRRLLNTLLGTVFHDRVTVRWRPGSWRMHVPLVYGKSDSIDLAEAAQLYFPRQQIAALTAILTDLSANETGTTEPRVV